MREKSRFWIFAVLVLMGAFLAACTGLAEESPPQHPSAQAADPSAAPTLNSIPLPTPTRTPAPTARPLLEDIKVDGVYQHTTLGVSFVYPKAWEINVESDNGLEFVTVGHEDIPALIYLTMDYVPEGEDFEVLAAEFFEWLQQNMEFSSVSWTTVDPDYELLGGQDAWRGIGEGLFAGVDDPLRFESIAAQRGSLVFQIITMGRIEWDQNIEIILENTRQSFQVFSPTPYGVIREQALFLPGSEPTTLDPAKWHGGPDSIMGDLFSGLVKLNNDLQVIPDLAETWTVSPDGRVYTFTLRQGVTFHDGGAFTAADVKYSWERACDPETGSDTAETYLGDIQGVGEVISGAKKEISGVKVLDDFTIEVTLDEPKAYFPYKLAYVTSWIVDRKTIEQIEDTPIGTGPFKLVEYDEGEVMILARNENYYRNFVSLEYVVYLVNQGYPVRLYEAGDIDLVAVNEDLVERAEDPLDPLYGNVQTVTGLCTNYVVFDVSKPPFDDPLVREAFTKAVDKERYNDVTSEGKGVTAAGLFPPGLPGYNVDVQAIPFDPDAAREALEGSTYGGADALPEILLTIAGEGGDLFPADAILLQMWEEVLGVSIAVEQIDFESYFDEIFAGNHGQLLTTGWCADYPDPENFADLLFHSRSEQNLAGYNNPELDSLLEQARSMVDVEARLALYQEIEQIIIDDMPVVFLEHVRPYYMITKPYVQGLKSNPIGVAQLMDVSILPEE